MAYTDGEYYFDTHRNNITAAAKGNGVVSGLGVTEAATPAKTVVVGTGVYVANGTSVTMASATTIDLSSHISATNPNKVIITADSAGSITATAGTAAVADPAGSTGPQTKVPLLPNLPANEIMLAEVWLATAETTILDADITDRREYIIERVNLAGAQTVAGVKTFSSFPVTPSSAPTTDYQVANKAYVDTLGAKVKTIWAEPQYVAGTGAILSSTNSSSYAGALCVDAQADQVRFTTVIPTNFTTLTKAVMVVISSGTGNIYRSVSTEFAATGESKTTHTDAIASAAVAVTANQIFDDDISAAFTGIAAGDRVGIQYLRTGGDALDTTSADLHVLGLLLEYT